MSWSALKRPFCQQLERLAAEPVEPPGAATPAKAELPGPRTLYRVFRNGRMWFLDPKTKTKKIVGEAPP